jgi:hypothetical protein
MQRISVEDALAHPFLRSVSVGHQAAVSEAGLEMVEGLLSLDASQLKEKLHSEVAAFAAENVPVASIVVVTNQERRTTTGATTDADTAAAVAGMGDSVSKSTNR